MRRRNTRSLRAHLLELVLITLIPAALLSAVVVYALWHVQEESRLASQTQTVEALSKTVEDAVNSSIRRARILASFGSAMAGDFASFQHFAGRMLEQSEDWSNVLLIAPDNMQVFNVRFAGQTLPRSPQRPIQEQVRRTGQLALSDVIVGVTSGQPLIDIVVPLQGRELQGYLLLVSLKLAHFDTLITPELQVPGSLSSLMDAQKRIIARNVDAEGRRGQQIRESNMSLYGPERRGSMNLRTIEGLNVHLIWQRTSHDWYVAYGAPRSEIRLPLTRSLSVLAAVWALLLMVAVAFAIRKARRLERFTRLIVERADTLDPAQEQPELTSDITEINSALKAMGRARDTIRIALQREQEAREAAEHANRAKDQFMAMLGHELRNPLAAISNAANVMQWDRSSVAQRETATTIISRQVGNLTNIVNDLLDVGRVMSGKIVLHMKPVNFADVVRAALDSLQVAGRLEHHRWNIDIADVQVNGDSPRLEQIVQNMLTNARTYTPEGKAIDVRLHAAAGEAVFQVADEGVGIAAGDLPHLFELFFQANQEAHRPYSGLGIGLTLVRQLVELHGGTVIARSTGPGCGSTFEVRLPCLGTAV